MPTPIFPFLIIVIHPQKATRHWALL